jgi:hypothetical protein
VTHERLKPVVVLVVLALSGCGGDMAGGDGSAAGPTLSTQVGTEPLTPSRCPSGLPSCRSAEGGIVYVEAVDGDGDGDAHFVIVDPQGISLPGITAIDVRRGLRPEPLPGLGERISAAGPVQTGTYGQSQIHAIELHVAGEAAGPGG